MRCTASGSRRWRRIARWGGFRISAAGVERRGCRVQDLAAGGEPRGGAATTTPRCNESKERVWRGFRITLTKTQEG
jgi:hypothetical protein